MSKEIMKKENTAVNVRDEMAALGITSEDIQISRLHMMQNTSDQVGEGNAKLGDIVNLATQEVLGGFDKPLELVPLRMLKNVTIMDMSGKVAKFKRVDHFDDVLDSKSNFVRECIDSDGSPIRRDLTLSFIVLLADDVKEGFASPCIISFKRTSLAAGTQMATLMVENLRRGFASYGRTGKIMIGKEKFESNTYATATCLKGRSLTTDELKTVAPEFLMVKGYDYKKIDNEPAKQLQQKQTVVIGSDDDIEM